MSRSPPTLRQAVLDLATLKPAPGDYLIAFYGSAVAKIGITPKRSGCRDRKAASRSRGAGRRCGSEAARSRGRGDTAGKAAPARQAAEAATARQKAAAAALTAATERLSR